MKIVKHDKTNLTKEKLVLPFYFGCKQKQKFKIGFEYERILVDEKSFMPLNYERIEKFLKDFAKSDQWNFIFDKEIVIGIEKQTDTITFEPGGQLEISLRPCETIDEIESRIENLNQKIGEFLKKHKILAIEHGILPSCHFNDVFVFPKRRYLQMDKYLPLPLSSVMMRQTAGIQGIFDFEDEDDAMLKLELASKIAPVASAMFANSPIYNKKDSGFKSYRAFSWTQTDEQRCGFADLNMFKEFSFAKYVQRIVKIPMIFIVRNSEIVEINGEIDFETFIEKGFKGFLANYDDFILHSSLFFPEVRLKNFLEIRNHDCQKGKLKYSMLSFYLGLFKDKETICKALELFKNLEFENFNEARFESCKFGLKGFLGKTMIADFACELLNISYKNLDEKNKKYLEYIMEIAFEGLCPADLILKNWYGSFNQDFSKFIKYVVSA